MKNTTRIIFTFILATGMGAVAANSKFYNGAFIDSFFAFTVLSFAILHLRMRPHWKDLAFILCGVMLFAIGDIGILHFPPKPMAFVSFIGLSSFVILPIRILWSEGDERKLLLSGYLPVLPFVVLGFFMPFVLGWTVSAHPKTLELYLLSFDASLGVQLSFLVGQAFARSGWGAFAGWFFYMALPVPIAVVFAGQLLRSKRRAFEAITAFLIAGPVGMIFYSLFPATGPRYLFGAGFPSKPFPIDQASRLLLEPVAIPGFRNAMPSLHLTCVLLACWYSRGLSWWERTITYVFFAFTVIATLGIGEHWFVDLIVAFPFALFLQALVSYSLKWSDKRRLVPLASGLAVTLAWLIALRYGSTIFWTSPIVPWALIVGTIALAGIWQMKLAQALDKPETSPGDLRGDVVPVPSSAD